MTKRRRSCMAAEAEPLTGGYDVDDNAIRFSNYFHVLREIVHLSCGHLALEPRFEVKALLGDHLHDDARAVTKIRRRLYELRHPSDYPGAPADDLGALLVRMRDQRPLRVMARLEQPARDAFIEITDQGDPYLTDDLYVNGEENHVPTEAEEQKHFFHGLMDAELCAAELMARNSHEHPEMPWDFHVDMARQTWDEIRHAEIHDRLMATELGCHWGDYAVGFGYFRSIYALGWTGRARPRLRAASCRARAGRRSRSWRPPSGRC